ncbi:LysR family transcriptional regulator [Hartmannibacter diazotrophicus]|uniref:LysR family transcriptional regulator n=1 Tax=Hartmannibacter diazotrophicus TaxID=1482074 RepID=UPI0012FD3E6C|nr:LysR family transcriptional regulator [Hartmannibacter diazotrophicus]
MNLRQLAAFIGVYEEGSFSAAARRLNATQSGLSMQIQNLEEQIGLRLFDRSPRGVVPTHSGQRLYVRAIDIMRNLDEISVEIRTLSEGVGGTVRIGLMPTFSRGVLAPALAAFIADYPNVKVSVVEAYSAVLTDEVAAGNLDFAIVPSAPQREGLRTRWLGTDRELLVRRAGDGPPHLSPVRLRDLSPMKLVLPARGNARRDAFDSYAELHGVALSALVDMDAMIATLEFVANSDFMTILPETICINDIDGTVRSLHPIADPALSVDYAVIEPAKNALLPAAELFLDGLERQYRLSKSVWQGMPVSSHHEN